LSLIINLITIELFNYYILPGASAERNVPSPPAADVPDTPDAVSRDLNMAAKARRAMQGGNPVTSGPTNASNTHSTNRPTPFSATLSILLRPT
jgi:hypothetical protein